MNTHRLLLFTVLAVAGTQLRAQTNTFPSTGNVGIGTTQPRTFLNVVGDTSSNGIRVVRFESPATDTGLTLANDTANGHTYSFFSSGNGSGLGQGLFSIIDETAGADRFVINGSGNVGIGTMNPTEPLNVNGKLLVQSSPISNGQGTFAGYITYSGPAQPGDVAFALRADTTNTGTQDTAGSDHLAGVLGYAKDVANSACNLIGIEGKVDGFGAIPSGSLNTTGHGPLAYVGVSGDAGYTGSNFAGNTLYGFCVTRLQVVNTDGVTPLLQGTVYGLYCPPITGGSTQYTLFGSNDIVTAGATVRALDSSQANQVRMYHDGTNGHLDTTGNLIVGCQNNGAVIVNSPAMVPNKDGNLLGLGSPTNLRWAVNATTGIFSGNVGIGTTTPGFPLDVNGTIHASEVLVDTTGADYVFKPAYRLASLGEVEQAIKRDGHLPGIPSAQEMSSRGVSVGALQTKLLAKVEELTLLMIQQDKRMQQQSQELQELKAENATMQARLNTMAK